MQRRMKQAKITFAVAAFVVLLGFAVQGHLEARQYKRLLTNSYYHAFSELTTAVGELDTALQKAAYTTPGPLQDSLYQQVYAKALTAQYALGELPYSNRELERTAAFLAKTGDYAQALCRGGCEGAAENLAALAAISGELNGTLAGLQGDLENGALDLGTVERAEESLARASEPRQQAPGPGAFQDIEADFPQLPSLVYDGPFSEHLTGQAPKVLEGLGQVSQAEAQLAAADFLHVSPGALSSAGEGAGAVPAWGFSLSLDGGTGYIEVTKQGGQVLEYFLDRAVGEAGIEVDQAVELAKNYLANWGFARMETSYHIRREGVLTIHFAPVTGEVYCYPDLVKVTIALDTGKLLGYEAHGYLNCHRDRTFAAPAVSRDAALSALPGDLTVLSDQLALIPTAGGTDEVLTWEFKCQAADGRHVLVYVNAATGRQQNILLLLEDETGTLTL